MFVCRECFGCVGEVVINGGPEIDFGFCKLKDAGEWGSRFSPFLFVEFVVLCNPLHVSLRMPRASRLGLSSDIMFKGR